MLQEGAAIFDGHYFQIVKEEGVPPNLKMGAQTGEAL